MNTRTTFKTVFLALLAISSIAVNADQSISRKCNIDGTTKPCEIDKNSVQLDKSIVLPYENGTAIITCEVSTHGKCRKIGVQEYMGYERNAFIPSNKVGLSGAAYKYVRELVAAKAFTKHPKGTKLRWTFESKLSNDQAEKYSSLYKMNFISQLERSEYKKAVAQTASSKDVLGLAIGIDVTSLAEIVDLPSLKQRVKSNMRPIPFQPGSYPETALIRVPYKYLFYAFNQEPISVPRDMRSYDSVSPSWKSGNYSQLMKDGNLDSAVWLAKEIKIMSDCYLGENGHLYGGRKHHSPGGNSFYRFESKRSDETSEFIKKNNIVDFDIEVDCFGQVTNIRIVRKLNGTFDVENIRNSMHEKYGEPHPYNFSSSTYKLSGSKLRAGATDMGEGVLMLDYHWGISKEKFESTRKKFQKLYALEILKKYKEIVSSQEVKEYDAVEI